MQLFNEQIMQAICWTLIHSLWQGLLLAVVAGVVMLLTKKSGSTLRYNLLSFLFFIFIATVFVTFLRQYDFSSVNNDDKIRIATNIDHVNKLQLTTISPLTDTDAKQNFFETFSSYFNTHASLIVTIWFIILSAQLLRLIANGIYIQRIKHYKTHPASAFWKQKLQQLAVRLHIHQQILLLESEMVKVPVMVGFFKPVILFPFQLMSQLPAEQVEAVLLHELAHIRRKDYLMNLLQNLAEMIFFFNPAVLWISSLIRDERENCCDDIAVAETKSGKDFVHALITFQEYKLNGSTYGLAFPGRKNHLLNRVKRILTNNNKTLSTMEKISLASGILVIGLITIAFKQNTTKEKLSFKTIQAKEIKNDTVPAKTGETTSTYNLSINGKKYEFTEVNGKVTELSVDGKRIPDEKIKDYQEPIDNFHEQMKKQTAELQAQKLLLEKQRAEMTDKEKLTNAEEAKLRELQEKANETAILKLKTDQEAANANMEELKKLQEKMAMEQSTKSNDELQLELKKQNEQLMQLSNDLLKRQNEIRDQLKSVQPSDYKQKNKLLNQQIQELRNERLQLEEQRLKIDKMVQDHNNGNSFVTPVQSAQPATLRVEGINASMEPVVVNGIDANAQDAITFTGRVSTSSLVPITLKGQPVKIIGKKRVAKEAKVDITFTGSASTEALVPVTVKGYPVQVAKENKVAADPERTITFKGTSNMDLMKPITIKGRPLKLADNNAFASWPLTNIIDDLAEQGIITDKENVELKLDNGVLMVNGTQQPEELHATMKNKYLKTDKSHILYSRHGYSMSGDIKN
jgi:bla regulator protein blaR1